MRDHPDKAEQMLSIVDEEMKNNLVFAQYAFRIQAGQETVDNLVRQKLIQNVY